MAATDRTSTDDADALAARLREASFVQLLVRADGGPIAAACLLADGCATAGTPFQASVVRTRAALERRREAAAEDVTVLPIGVRGEGILATAADGGPRSTTAFEVAEALGAEPDPALSLAGVVADGAFPEDVAPTVLEGSGLERAPGLASPVADPADGLAHSTLAHAQYSGDVDAAEAVVAELPADADDVDRRLASMLAIDATGEEDATPRAAESIERAIHPLVGGPFETVEGYADVLGALSTAAPGAAIQAALGSPPEGALEAWRAHARNAHEGVRSAALTRHDGLVVVETAGPVRTVARLVRDFRSPEPAVLAVGDGEAALATVDDPAEPIEAAAESAGGSGLAGATRGYARFDAGRADELVDAIEEAI